MKVSLNVRSLGPLLVLSFLLSNACSHTPGDAALRGGHPQAAANLYLKGAELGHSDAALKLGLLLEDGKIGGSQYKTAAHWYKRACELDNPAGCHNAGVAYEYGKSGVEKNLEEAKAYYLKAAARGFMQSQYNLGSMYSNNYITPPDDVQGYKWMLLAEKAARACPKQPLCDWILRDPPEHRSKLKSRLSESGIKEAEIGAAAWKPRR